jgi:hypothetical protein
MRGWIVAVALAAAVSTLDESANGHRQPWGDWLATGLFASYASYCVQNFVRCREVHCAVTAPGFLAAAVPMVLCALGLAHIDYSLPWIVFVASACTGYCAQWVYKMRTGSAFLKS